ncbi:MAG: DUF2911 domain-containing protein [Vicinamibacterales bacterium]
MFRFGKIAAVAVLAGLATVTLAAQKTTQLAVGGGGSPHVKSEWTIDGANISVEYGRPFLKGRPEDSLMPAGKPWRTGADAATIITSDKPLKFGSVTLPAGTHTINTVPGANEWQLLLGKLGKPGQWGIPYAADLEVGKVPMKLGKTASPAEQVTISIDDTPAGGTLRIEWGSKSATAPFTVG